MDSITRELYSIAMNQKAEGKMGNASTLQLLTELEKEIDMHMQDLDCYDSIETNVVINESKPILAEVRKRNREEKLFKEKIENQEKQRKKQEERMLKYSLKQENQQCLGQKRNKLLE